MQLLVNVWSPCAGDGKGDACATDYDGDGVADEKDVCPRNAKIHETSFYNPIKVTLDKTELDLFWTVNNVGCPVPILQCAVLHTN